MDSNEQPIKKEYKKIWQEETREKIRSWWESLGENTGERAFLRRCHSPGEGLLSREAIRLGYKVDGWLLNKPEALGTIAVLLALIKETDEIMAFPARLGSKGKGDKAIMSEIRFRHLLACREWQDLFSALRRALALCRYKADPLSVADGVLLWEAEKQNDFLIEEQNSFRYIWSRDYYNEIFKINKKKE